MLIDTPGQPLRTRPRGGLGLRPVDEGSGERQVQATVYGDAGSDGPAHSLGRPVRQYDTAGEVRMSYDFRGRVVEQVRRVFEDIDALDRVVEQTAPNGSETAYSYDPGGKLLGIELDAAAVVEEILYNARGQRLSITYGNGTETTYEYDEDRFWLTRLLTMRSTEPLQDLTYTHDAVGNILAVEDDAQQTFYFSNTQVTPEQTFGYDSRYRLVEATGREKIDMAQTTHAPPAPGAIPDAGNPALRTYVQSTTYDAAGNITQMHHVPSSGSNWTRNYSIHADNNQLLATSIPGNSSAYDDEYAYNERGAMVFMPHLRAGVSENVVRDFRDQVRKVLLLNSGDEAWYATDAAGQRVRKLVRHGQNAHERIYVGGYEIYRPMDTIAEELVVEIHTVHVMDGEQRVLMAETRTVIDDEPVTSPVAVLRYQYSNHLGTATLECDEEGEIISYEEYHPYGTCAWWAGDSATVSQRRYRYTGMERDEETGLAVHGVRYYAAWLGRWGSADPIGLGDGGNRFAYVRGNPVGGRDPTGLVGTDDEVQINPDFFLPSVPSPRLHVSPFGNTPVSTHPLGLTPAYVPNSSANAIHVSDPYPNPLLPPLGPPAAAANVPVVETARMVPLFPSTFDTPWDARNGGPTDSLLLVAREMTNQIGIGKTWAASWGLFDEFATGAGLEVRVFVGDDHPFVQEMRQSPGVEQAIHEFYKFNEGRSPGQLSTTSSFYAFSPTRSEATPEQAIQAQRGALDSGIRSMVGGYYGVVSETSEGQLQVALWNETSMNSLWLHIPVVSNKLRQPGTTTPFGTTQQWFVWNEEIEPERLQPAPGK